MKEVASWIERRRTNLLHVLRGQLVSKHKDCACNTPDSNKTRLSVCPLICSATATSLATLCFFVYLPHGIQMRPFGRVYRRTNFYRDMTDLSDVAIKFTPSSKLSTTSKEIKLALLRKFIFSMHYRNDVVYHTYVQEENFHLGRRPKRDST